MLSVNSSSKITSLFLILFKAEDLTSENIRKSNKLLCKKKRGQPDRSLVESSCSCKLSKRIEEAFHRNAMCLSAGTGQLGGGGDIFPNNRLEDDLGDLSSYIS
ncbi:unnamed protein product [Cuscuta epithymum]|uniref:Uncharacterized protein n=1 Tax=Cuscuta epithymum TaxID=186058 RepID=A0AAV0E373_9ASTE|nr:unnamed protein product [Cuscuta epithymum]